MSRKPQIAILIILFVFFSCNVSRDMKRDKTRDFTELIKDNFTKVKRVGDTVRTKDLYKYHFKDTTIYNVNRVTGTTQLIKYDNQGQIKLLECQSGHIDILQKQNERLLTLLEKDTKEVQKNFELKPIIIVYFFIGLGLLFLSIGLFIKYHVRRLVLSPTTIV